MRNLSPALITFLQNNKSFMMADLYTIEMVSGEALRWADFDRDVSVNGWSYSCSAAVLTRDKTRLVIGVEVDTYDLVIAPKTGTTAAGMPLLQAVRAGVFDGAKVRIERAFFDSAMAVVGTVVLFAGRMADVQIGRNEIKARVNSILELLAVKLPRNLYQTGCVHTLYDPGCGLNRTAQARGGYVAAGSTVSVIACDLTMAAGFFERGYVQILTGPLAGTKRTIKRYSPGSLTLLMPLPSVPAVGESLIAWPGCDKSAAVCASRFANIDNFRGYPYIPVPETAV
jgi:uncharacterized phage protein (TIGR02218 family)